MFAAVGHFHFNILLIFCKGKGCKSYKDPDSGKESSGTVRTGNSEQYDHRDEKVDKNPSPVEKGVNPDPPKKESSSGSDNGSDNNDSGGSSDEKIAAPE